RAQPGADDEGRAGRHRLGRDSHRRLRCGDPRDGDPAWREQAPADAGRRHLLSLPRETGTNSSPTQVGTSRVGLLFVPGGTALAYVTVYDADFFVRPSAYTFAV